MAKRAASGYMTTLERILGGVHFCIYLLVLPFVTGPLFALLERLLGSPIPDNVQNMIYYYVLFAVTVVIFWNYLGRTTGYFLSAPWRTVGTALMGLVAFYGLNELAYRLLGLVLDGMTNLNDVAISAQVRDAPRSTALIVVFLAPFVEEGEEQTGGGVGRPAAVVPEVAEDIAPEEDLLHKGGQKHHDEQGGPGGVLDLGADGYVV